MWSWFWREALTTLQKECDITDKKKKLVEKYTKSICMKRQ